MGYESWDEPWLAENDAFAWVGGLLSAAYGRRYGSQQMANFLKLTSARVTNFACFEDTGDVPIDPHVTVLLAENENGKSSFLRALGWFSDLSTPFDEDDRWDQAERDTALDIIALTFQMNQPASAALKERCGIKAPKLIRVIRRTDGSFRVQDAGTDEDLQSAPGFAFDLARSQLTDFIRGIETSVDLDVERRDLTELLAAAKHDDADSIAQSVTYARDHLIPHLDEGLGEDVRARMSAFEAPEESLLPVLREFLPTTIYFGEDVEELIDAVSYEDAASNPEAFRTMINLASLVGEDLPAMAGLPPHERQRRSRNASATVSSGVSKYWAEGGITVHITFEETRMVVSITHKDRDQKPSRRSRGLRWFLGFYVNFNARTNGDLRGAILLLDEPGIFLHLKQQTKFLELVDSLSRANQIVYSTQLPKMVPVAKLDRLRLLVADDEATHKVTVEANVRAVSSSADVTQPIRARLGMGLAESISLGNVNVVVEGWVDPILVDSMNLFCRREGRASLPEDVTLYAAGGAGKKMLPGVATVVAGPAKGLVMVDDDKAGREAERTIRKAFGDLVPIVRVMDGQAEPSGREIEDLLSRSYYLELVNAAHQARIEGFVPITAEEIGEAPIVDAIEAVFKRRKYGGFQKIYPARELRIRLEAGDAAPDAETLDNFGGLFERLNAGLASLESNAP